jgi:cbb3-type cytochrome c oxidase subunit III
MKVIALRLVLIAALTVALLFQLAPSAQVDSSAQSAIDAKALFEKNCAKCHGKDGRAKTFRGKVTGARNLTDEAWQAKASDEQIKSAIKTGPDEMPAFEGKLSEAEIDALLAYVRKFRGTAPKK